MDVADGTGISERIGGKIKPIKLRIYGSLSFNDPYSQFASYTENNAPGQPNQGAGWMESDVRWSFAVRLFVYQVRGGNSNEHPQSKAYHPLPLKMSLQMVLLQLIIVHMNRCVNCSPRMRMMQITD